MLGERAKPSEKVFRTLGKSGSRSELHVQMPPITQGCDLAANRFGGVAQQLGLHPLPGNLIFFKAELASLRTPSSLASQIDSGLLFRGSWEGFILLLKSLRADSQHLVTL